MITQCALEDKIAALIKRLTTHYQENKNLWKYAVAHESHDSGGYLCNLTLLCYVTPEDKISFELFDITLTPAPHGQARVKLGTLRCKKAFINSMPVPEHPEGTREAFCAMAFEMYETALREEMNEAADDFLALLKKIGV